MTTIVALGITSAVSVCLILLNKRQQGSHTWTSVAFGSLVAWATVLPFILYRQFGLSSFESKNAVLVGVLVAVAALSNVLISRRFGWNVTALSQLRNAAIQTPWRTLALMIVVAPICEEYIFRGFFLLGFLGLGAIAAVSLSALVFAVAHADLASIPHLVIAGILFGALAVASGGLATPILAHGISNAIGFVALRYAPLTRLLGSDQ